MQLNIRALAIASAILCGVTALSTGIANLLFPSYGVAVLEFAASGYPGYHGPDGFGSVIVVTMYAGVVGAVMGAVLAWLYNMVMGRGAVAAA